VTLKIQKYKVNIYYTCFDRN